MRRIGGLMAFLVTLASAFAAHAERLVLEGEITRAQHQSYLELPFEAPAGVERLTVTLSYGGRDERTTIDLGLRDPNGLRGWSGGNKSTVTIAESDATPSYVPGPITPGVWHVILGVPNIREGVTAPYRIEILMERADAAALTQGFGAAPIRAEAGWYRGDFHTHTGHSDGSCASLAGKRAPCPAFRTIEAARAAGLNFIAVTEHNTASHHAELRALQAYYDTLLILPGREITTFYGHANVIGPLGALPFQLGSPRLETLGPLLEETKRQGGIISVNHPRAPSGEACMGCGWAVADTDWSRVDAVEIANGGTMRATGSAEGPLSGIPFWHALLDQGHRIVAIAGSDNHDPDDAARQSPVGRPATVVFAEALSQPALLQGVRDGRVFIDLVGAPGARLDLRATSRAGEAAMGGALPVRRGERPTLDVMLQGFAGMRLEVVTGAGAPPPPAFDADIRSVEERKTLQLAAARSSYWIRVNVRNARGQLLAVSNPIFVTMIGSSIS